MPTRDDLKAALFNSIVDFVDGMPNTVLEGAHGLRLDLDVFDGDLGATGTTLLWAVGETSRIAARLPDEVAAQELHRVVLSRMAPPPRVEVVEEPCERRTVWDHLNEDDAEV